MAEHAAITQVIDFAWANGQRQASANRCVKVANPVAEETELELIDFNISGTYFSVSKQLLQKYPESKLAECQTSEDHWSEQKEAYYFDRDPTLFNAVLNIFRYNMVAIPAGYSEVMFKREMKFWNISWDELETKCSAELDEEIEKEFVWMEGRIPPPPESASIHAKRKYRIWCFLTDPQGEHTPYRKFSMAFASINILFTTLYMILFGMITSKDFLVAKSNETGQLESVMCQSAFECLEKGNPPLWLDSLLRVLLTYLLLETGLRLIICPSYRFYLSCVVVWFDIIASTCLIVLLPFYLIPVADDDNSTLFDSMNESDQKSVLDLGVWMMGAQVLRVFKVFQYATVVDGLMVMVLTLRASLKELGLLVIYLLVCMFVFSTLVTFAELYSADGIPNCLIGYWWAIVTMTTVGYGDYYPSTPLGYVVGVFCAVVGLIMTALPVAVIGNNFYIYWDHNNKRKKVLAAAKIHIQQAGTVGNDLDAKRSS